MKYIRGKLRKLSNQSEIDDLRHDVADIIMKMANIETNVSSLKGELTKLKNIVSALRPYVEPKPLKIKRKAPTKKKAKK
jgi:predicted  nucleic acid-binding Zn-ribbon protein